MPRFTFTTVLWILGCLVIAALVWAACQIIPVPYRL